MKNFMKNYKWVLLSIIGIGVLYMVNKEMGLRSVNTTIYSLKEMLTIIPPVFILLGLLDVWVPREVMMKHMGEGSGIKGIALSFILGSAAAGPLYAAFPISAVFMKKGVKFSNILIFIGAWSTTKVPMFLFELASLGPKFAFTRLLIDIPGIMIIAYIITSILSKKDVEEIYARAEKMD